MNYVYMLRCGDGSLYTGWTNDLTARVAKHQAGKGCKYTRSHQPVELVWHCICRTEHEARSLEYRIKQLPREEKLRIAAGEAVRGIATNTTEQENET